VVVVVGRVGVVVVVDDADVVFIDIMMAKHYSLPTKSPWLGLQGHPSVTRLAR
jgi:hypothetical protein